MMSSSSSQSPLTTSVHTLTNSLTLLNSTINTLSTATSDYPRIRKLLTVNRHFELLSEPEILAAQAALSEEIVPEFNHLLGKVEMQLERMERRENGLVSKSELLKGRVEGAEKGRGRGGGVVGGGMARGTGGSVGGVGVGGGVGGGGGGENAEKMRQLRAKKERLAYTVERLNLQKSQKHRQLRMSMSYKEVI